VWTIVSVSPLPSIELVEALAAAARGPDLSAIGEGARAGWSWGFLLDALLHVRPLLTAVAVGVFLLVLGLVERWVRTLDVTPDQRRRTRKAARSAALLLLLGLLVSVWAAKLKTVGLVLSGFAVALIVASKEVIMCITGFWVKMAGGTFRIGDRVVIKGVRGDVLDYGLLTTTLLVVSDGSERPSGTVLVLPNSAFLQEPVRNESREVRFANHTISVVVPTTADWQTALSALEQAVGVVWQAEAPALREQVERLSQNHGVGLPIEPTVLVRRVEKDATHLAAQLALPSDRIQELEDAILRRYLCATKPAATDVSPPIDAPTTDAPIEAP
jgi:small-conductance mechanosensitive channel